jgi:DNA-directed RNA polymerase specialized sigma24 family protein
MTKAASVRPVTPGPTPVQAALADPAVQEELARHAAARLGALLADRPHSVRQDVAKDVVQGANRRALSVEPTFHGSQATAAAWLHGILERVLHEHCRALRKQPAQPCADPAGWDELEARLGVPDHRSALMRLLDSLPAEQRRVVTICRPSSVPPGRRSSPTGTAAAPAGCSPTGSRASTSSVARPCGTA